MQKCTYLYDYSSGRERFVSGMNRTEFFVSQTTRSGYVALCPSGNDDARIRTPPEGALTPYETALVSQQTSDTEAALNVVDAFISAEASAERYHYGRSLGQHDRRRGEETLSRNGGSVEPKNQATVSITPPFRQFLTD